MLPDPQTTTRPNSSPLAARWLLVALLCAAAAAFAWRMVALRVPPRPTDAPLRTEESGVRALLQARLAAQSAPNDLPARLRSARLLMEFRFLPAARREYADLLRLHPQDVQVVRGLARVLVRQGQPEEAARHLLPVADRDPEARVEAAEALRLAGEARRALDILRTGAVGDSPARLRAEAAAWIDLGEPQKAVAALVRLPGSELDAPETTLIVGRVLGASTPAQLFSGVGQALLRAASNARQTGPILYAVGLAAERAGDTQAAAQAYRQAAEADPRFVRGYLRLSALLERESRRRPALRAAALRFRGLYERAENNPRGALAAFMEEMRLHPHILPPYLDASQSLEQLDRPQEAINLLRRALKARPDSPECWTKLALTCHEWNRPAEALAAARGLEKAAGPKALGMVRLLEGRIYLKSGQASRAAEAFRQASAADPGNQVAHYWLGKALLESGGDRHQAAEAAEHLQRAVEAEPEATDYRIALGDARLRAGQPEAAIEPLERAIEQAPTRPEAYSLLSQALRRQGETAAAGAAIALYGQLDAAGKRERALVRAVERSGKKPEPRLALAAFYLEAGDLEAARRVYLPAVRFGRPPESLLRKFRQIERLLGLPPE